MLIGKNIRLRPFQQIDVVNIIEMKQDFEGIKAFGGPPFPSNTESELQWINSMYPKGLPGAIYFAIDELTEHGFAGYCVARNINYINRNADVGVIIAQAARGKGYYKEVCFLFYDYLFNQLNLRKLYSFVIKGNFILDVDKKIGFVEEGLIKDHLFQDGEYHDLIFVSLFKENFYRIWEKRLENFTRKNI